MHDRPWAKLSRRNALSMHCLMRETMNRFGSRKPANPLAWSNVYAIGWLDGKSLPGPAERGWWHSAVTCEIWRLDKTGLRGFPNGQCRMRAHLARSINAPNIVVSSDPFLPSPNRCSPPVTTLSARHPAPRIVAAAISSVDTQQRVDRSAKASPQLRV